MLNKIIFSKSNKGFDYVVEKITLEQKKLNELNEFMELYSDQYDLSDIALLPKELVNIGEVTVMDQNTND